MQESWSRDVTARAARYWTAARTAALTGGKQLPLMPAAAAPLLRALGLLNGDGSMPRGRQRKYLQVNHLVALLEPAFLEVAARAPTVRIVDVCCGRSYLTFLLAWCFARRWQHPVEILGIDRNPLVIAKSEERFDLCGLPPLARFRVAPLEGLDLDAQWQAAFGGPLAGPPDALVALHACDTATDRALALGLDADAGFIAVAPCCQAELARRWAGLAAAGARGAFAPVWESPHLRREIGARVTDAMRAKLLEARGYDVVAMEFVPYAHTPRNTLLRAHRRDGSPRPAALAAYRELKAATGDEGILLETLSAGCSS